MADTIVVLEDGRIIEQGDHETLMNLDDKMQIDVQHSGCTLCIGELVAPESRGGV